MQSRKFIERLYHRLQARLNSNSNHHIHTVEDIKETRTAAARQLLGHMTKATVQVSMFENPAALRGYIRHKFVERAMLCVNSLLQISPNHAMYAQLHKVTTIVSLGCGPGCDGVGALTYLRGISPLSRCRRLVLLDWAMQHWSLLIEPLVEELHSTVDHASTVVEMATANVREPLEADVNAHARQLLDTTNQTCLYLISYLLSETRGEWQVLLDDLMQTAGPGALFWLADPTAWQLHAFRQRYDMRCWLWLDSSMGRPDLQPLENRVGPAILMGMKKL